MNRILIITAILAFTVLLTVGGWFGVDWVQMKRADDLLLNANSHVEKANAVMAEIKVDQLGSESFSSLDSINQAASATESMMPLLDQATTEISGARDNVSMAAGFLLLDEWYRSYLLKKQEAAEIRLQQLEVLAETADRLHQLYSVGPVVFSSIQEMDRLFGQFQDALGKVQSSPVEASTSLIQVANSFSQLQQQLDQAYSENSFEILPELSRTAAENAELALLAAQLADAAGAGDQARAQQAAVGLEGKLLSATISDNLVDLWWQQQIEPLERNYSELQSRQDTLDKEAAALYEARYH